MSVLIIGEAERKAIQGAISRAKEHVIPIEYTVAARVDEAPEGVKLPDRKPDAPVRPTSEQVISRMAIGLRSASKSSRPASASTSHCRASAAPIARCRASQQWR